MILEVCVDSLDSMLTAKSAGADRIELCSALNIGGLTPSRGLMEMARTVDGMEIFVMIRPRSGDFLYSENDFEVMRKDIKTVVAMGFDGIVTGVLRSDGTIDTERLRVLAEDAKPLKTVLHRAFDDAKAPERQVPELIEMGICRILTSGQRRSAPEGADYLAALQATYGAEITIMPGGGVNAGNIEALYAQTGCTHYHLSGKVTVDSGMMYRDYMERMGTPMSERALEKADYELISSARGVLDRLKGF